MKDKIEGGELEVEHMGTAELLADVHTKPQQGKLFYTMRSHLMNCPVDYDDEKERLETHPALLPTEGYVEMLQGESAKILEKAVAMLVVRSLARGANEPLNQRRSVLRDNQSRHSSTVHRGTVAGSGSAASSCSVHRKVSKRKIPSALRYLLAWKMATKQMARP